MAEQPVERRPMSPPERVTVRQLARCRLPSYGFARRLVVELASRLSSRPALISEREAAWLPWFCWHFRRQLPSQHVPAQEPPKPPPAPKRGRVEGEPRPRRPSPKAQALQAKYERALRGQW